jgi:transposase InsO family protein
MQKHAKEYPVRSMARVLEVSPSGYYDWLRRPPSAQTRRREKISQAVAMAHTANRQVYGYRRIHAELEESNDVELQCCPEMVRLIMAECGLKTVRKRKYVVTTKADQSAVPAPDRIGRDFEATGPNQKWAADITYIATAEGWLYLAVILDLFSRRVVGWATSSTIDAQLVCSALRQAAATRWPSGGLVHHSDRGSQYTAKAFQELLEQHGIDCSMGRKGDPWDNAPSESFFATLKTELVHRRFYATRDQAHHDLFEYIEVFYNRQRRHSALGYNSPDAYERMWAA